MKKIMAVLLAGILATATMAGCSNNGSNQGDGTQDDKGLGEITVISREDGSGTRGAFIELFGVEKKNDIGEKIDYTIDTADITNSTSVMMTGVKQNEAAIGYISLGAMNESVKALDIDGAAATVANIKNGSYKISRPFNIATKEQTSPVAKDFVDFILSADGQKVIEEAGYISATEGAAYNGNKPSGKMVIAGSSSVTPVMEKLKEAYQKVNGNAQIEMQQSDSTTGMTATADGICDIGMASRALKDSELAKGVKGTVIALDGIAVIVNQSNPINGLSKDQVAGIYTGEITDWNEING